MQNQTSLNNSQALNKQDELILVVKRDSLFENKPAWQGIAKLNFENYLNIINEKKEFLPRSIMELDFNYKQIIPYLVFTHDNKLFLMQRTAQATETRLRNKFSLGIGGHIRIEDMIQPSPSNLKNLNKEKEATADAANSIIEWAKREFHEEVEYNDNFEIEPLGILNDDSTDVGKVHIGFVFLLKGNSDKIKVKSELKSGELFTFEECSNYFENMELWSQIVFKALNNL